MKKIEKGAYGYIRSQKIRRTMFTVLAFLVPAGLFAAGLLVTHKRENMFTFAAIMCCLPASRLAVGMIMMLLRKSMSREDYERTKKAAKCLPQLYEMVFTAYEKTSTVDCLVLGPNSVIGYSSDPKINLEFVEKHLTEILQNNGVKRNVKIFREFTKFESRVKEMTTLEKAEEAALRNEKAIDVLKTIAL